MSLACPEFIGKFAPGLCRAIDDYCQVSGPGWDAEAMNTWGNAAFLIAAMAGWRLLSQNPNAKAHVIIRALTLIALLAAAGGYAFHRIDAPWAKWGEIVPLVAFMLLYFWLLLRRFFHWHFLIAVPALLLYAAAIYWLEVRSPGLVPFGRALNLPTLVVFLLASIGFVLRQRESFWPMFRALVVLLLSSVASMSAWVLCERLGVTSHAIVHLLDALLLYLLLRLGILHAP